jgi:hypothetical protein
MMNNRMNWLRRQVTLGWVLLAAGIAKFVVGVLVQLLAANLPFNARIITAGGILLVGLGISNLVRYGAALRDPQAAKRLVSEELDERMLAQRGRAGNLAYWVSTGMAFMGLMWVSFAENGSLPPLNADMLWYFLAGVVIVPFVVYVVSLWIDQERS